MYNYIFEWRIQDFPEWRGANPKGGEANLLLTQIILKTAWNAERGTLIHNLFV